MVKQKNAKVFEERRREHWAGSDKLVFSGSGFTQMPRVVPMLAALADTLTDSKSSAGKLYMLSLIHI